MSTVEGMKLNDAVRTDIKNSVLCWLATVDQNGTPNVTPKEIFSWYGDDKIVIADIASANSVRNIQTHPAVCVSFIDVFRQRGFKITGTGSIIGPDHEEFQSVGADLLRLAGNDFPIRHMIVIRIERISRIWAPSYKLFPDRTENERMQDTYKTYGVVPVSE